MQVIVYPQKQKLLLLPVNDGKQLFECTLVLRDTPRGPRPGRFIVRREKDDVRQPDEAIELLRLAGGILVARGGDEHTGEEFRAMLSAYQLRSEYVSACRFCLGRGRYSPIGAKAVRYRGELICEDCAKNELLRELQQMEFGQHSCDRLLGALQRTRDLDRVLCMVNPDRLDPEVTRYDTIQSSNLKSRMKFRDLALDGRFMALFPDTGELLPVQHFAVDAGLLRGANLLIVSATATGKTLIGELAGIENLLKGRGKMLFLVPLVALANQKYAQFRKYAKLGLAASIRVGMSRISSHAKSGLVTSLSSDIIVGTYEGLDHVLRSGRGGVLGKIGTVVIDEVHMLEDTERGHRIDGLIARLKHIAPQAQFIYLSATVGDPEYLGRMLGAGVVVFEERPVPIERHLVFSQEHDKKKVIEQLARREYEKVSGTGFRGQTIVFTNSRRNCHHLADTLGIRAAAYHAGLLYAERQRIEHAFGKGELPVVVTTAALGAGVDFPASQVIFESLAMGIEWLTPGEFRQMTGRAGRPGYHEKGIVVLLAEPGKRFRKGESEDEVAFRLLRGGIEGKEIQYGEEEQLEETLANIAVAGTEKELAWLDSMLIGRGKESSLPELMRKLERMGLSRREGGTISLTQLGKVAASHFLTIDETFRIKDGVRSGKPPLDILAGLECFDSVYFRHAFKISAALGSDIPARVFGAALDIVFCGDSLSKFGQPLREPLLRFAREFLTCKCRDSPFCGCPERKFTTRLIELRRTGLTPAGLIRELSLFGVYAYEGDLLEYLDSAVRYLEAIRDIAAIFNKEIAGEAQGLVEEISGAE